MKNSLLQYSVLTFIIILVVSFGLINILTSYVADYTINSHIKIYPDMVKIFVKNNQLVKFYFEQPPGTLETRGKWVFSDFLLLGNIIRLKIWDNNGTILWSDDPNIVGKNFSNNIHFRQAILGESVYSIEEPNDEENAGEKEFGRIIEIYIPVIIEDEIIGVIELYESDAALAKQIADSSNLIGLFVALAGLCLYFLQFYIFYSSYHSLKEMNKHLHQVTDVTLFSLASLAETRDNDTGRHLERTSRYVRILAEGLAEKKKYKNLLTPEYIDNIVESAPLHDIGKVGVADSILLKPGKLTEQEFEEMKKHCLKGAVLLKEAEKKLDFNSFLSVAVEITHFHHERWDGGGYPEGLVGDRIPLPARIMALADVYDALRSTRCYKKSVSHTDSCEIIKNERGKHFDPDIVDVFWKQEKEFERISLTVISEI